MKNKNSKIIMWNNIKLFFDAYLSNSIGGTKFIIDLSEILTCATILTGTLLFQVICFVSIVFLIG